MKILLLSLSILFTVNQSFAFIKHYQGKCLVDFEEYDTDVTRAKYYLGIDNNFLILRRKLAQLPCIESQIWSIKRDLSQYTPRKYDVGIKIFNLKFGPDLNATIGPYALPEILVSFEYEITVTHEKKYRNKIFTRKLKLEITPKDVVSNLDNLRGLKPEFLSMVKEGKLKSFYQTNFSKFPKVLKDSMAQLLLIHRFGNENVEFRRIPKVVINEVLLPIVVKSYFEMIQ